MSSDILLLLYALVAALTSAALLLIEIDVPSALLSGAAVFVVAMQIQNTVLNRLLKRKMARELTSLRASNASIRTELEETRRKVTDITLALAKRSDAQEKKVIGELHIIESLVREFAAGVARKTESEKQALPLSQPGSTPAIADNAASNSETDMLEIIRRALEENHVDLHLQPVVALPQRKIRFYEALSRLRSGGGRVIMPAQYIRIAAPAGLMSVVDNLLLFRCIQVVRRLTQKRRDVGVFCNISGHTLSDAEFFPQFLDFLHHHRDLTGQIVFEFTQSAVLKAGDQEEANLQYLSGLGFALSMDQVSVLDMDFARLKALGFRHIKVPAQTLISGMQNAHAAVAAEDLKDLLARNGLSLIVERIESEKTVVQLLDYNVDFGQGYLFGEPKPIREVADAHDPRVSQPVHGSILPAELNKRLAG